jgi:hypothetical protein
MRNGKGLSPLIAAVILIAATMTIAAVIAFWTTGFVKTRLTEAESITGGTECFGAEFILRSGSLDGNTLNLILDNRKSVDLTLKNLFLIYPDNNVEQISLEDEEVLRGNEIRKITVTIPTTYGLNFLTGEIKTQCPDVSVYFTYDQISGTQTTTVETTTSTSNTTVTV